MRTERLSWTTVAVVLAGCAGARTKEPEKPKQPVEKVFDVRGDAGAARPDGDPDKHTHVWEQKGIHPYQVMRNGVPNTELCVISRCAICGATMHECEMRSRRAR